MKVLRLYQKQGVVGIEKRNHRALLADAPGVGKTVQALVWLYRNQKKLLPALVICPANAKVNWKRETLKWLGLKAQILEGKTPYSSKVFPVTIINFDIVSFWEKELIDRQFKTIIIDEAQYIKNPQIKRSKSIKKIAYRKKYILGMTGTPIENRVMDIYNIINIINPTLFPNYYAFAMRYCGAKNSGFGWKFDGASNTQELFRILKKSIMIRRLKKDVLKDLPPIDIITMPLEIDNRKEYDHADDAFLEYIAKKYEGDIRELAKKVNQEVKEFNNYTELGLDAEIDEEDIQRLTTYKVDKSSKASTLVQIRMLQQLAVKGMMNQFLEWVEDFLESGNKLVIFGLHRFVIDAIYDRFESVSVRYYGSTSKKNKQRAIDSFQNNPDIKLFVANMFSAGVAITLTAANYVAIVEYPWNPSKLQQAIDRVHRFTQTKQVTAYKFIAVNTIMEKINKILFKKENISDAVLDGKDLITQKLLTEIIASYKKEKTKKKTK